MTIIFNPEKAPGYDTVSQLHPDLQKHFLESTSYTVLRTHFLEHLSEYGSEDGTIWADYVLSPAGLANLIEDVGVDDVVLFVEEVLYMMEEAYAAYQLTDDEQWDLIVNTLLAFAKTTGALPSRDYVVHVCFYSCGGLVDRDVVDLVYETYQIGSRPVEEVVAGWTDR